MHTQLFSQLTFLLKIIDFRCHSGWSRRFLQDTIWNYIKDGNVSFSCDFQYIFFPQYNSPTGSIWLGKVCALCAYVMSFFYLSISFIVALITVALRHIPYSEPHDFHSKFQVSMCICYGCSISPWCIMFWDCRICGDVGVSPCKCPRL